MGESEMKMDEQPSARIEEKMSALVSASGDGEGDAKQETAGAEGPPQEDEQPTETSVLNGGDESQTGDDQLIETHEVVEDEPEMESAVHDDELEIRLPETDDHEDADDDEERVVGEASEETHVDDAVGDAKNEEFEIEAPIDTGDDEHENDEDAAEVDNTDKIEQKPADSEDVEEDAGAHTAGDAVSSSILEDALKNGNNENPTNLNKMHMEDVREGCDTAQPSSPGHAELRTEMARDAELCEDGTQLPDAFSAPNSIKIEGDSDDDKCIKRKNSEEEEDVDEPTKKLKKEIQQETFLRNKILMEYTDALDMSNMDQIQNEEDKLIVEIQNLDDIAKEKERQWNNVIHVKKMKEELLLRIQRQKHVCLMTNGLEITSDGEASNHLDATMNGQRALLPARPKQEVKTLSQHSVEMNGHDPNKGRTKGPVRNVQSIIADYRQRHPEVVPRRGRRIRNINGNASDSSSANNRAAFTSSGGTFTIANVSHSLGAQVRPVDANSEIAHLLSSMDNGMSDAIPNESAESASTYKEFLDQIAHSERRKAASLAKQPVPPPPLSSQYPEVTVHAVTSSSPSNAPTNSLLHGILTKAQVKTDSRTTFSPTLARLLTAPDKTHGAHPNKSSNVSISDILSTNKARSEITITPVTSDYEEGRTKRKHNVEEETEDSVDRLVIDESTDLGEARMDNNSDTGDEVPQCQGCNQKAAQFVCAGCGNQWYCSRECQVTAWDEHSDVCSG